MYNISRAYFTLLLALTCVVLLPATVDAQCFGIPSVTALGSNKFPVGLCAPVQANVTYTVSFTSPVPAGKLELIYDWGDGSPQTVVPLTAGSKTYNASETHTFPEESDCEYDVVITMRYNGELCTKTNQVQKISSWRTDKFNGGEVGLASPATHNDVHLVCEGENVDVIFQDVTNWNCNIGDGAVESPNNEYRWQQIVYNTTTAASKIPNIQVENTPVTGANGSDIVPNFQDPRGTFFMSAPVLVDDARRRPSLRITAPGGFGAQFPKAGNEFAVTLRYWNFCNPYDDPEIPGPPADQLNGDHPPVERQAFIRIIAPPLPLRTTDQAVCYGTTPAAFSVTGLAKDNIVKWYKYVPGSDVPGGLITSGKSASLPITSHPSWKNNTTPGVYKVWATQKTNSTAATNCESPAILVTRIIKEELRIPNDLLTAFPAAICNGQSFTVTFSEPATEAAGGVTKYIWAGSPGLDLVSSTPTSVTFTANVPEFDTTLLATRTLTGSKRYENAPACSIEKAITMRVYKTPVGGTLSGNEQVCEKDSVGAITLVGYTGAIVRWEMKKDEGSFFTYTGATSGKSIFPGKLRPGNYWFRAVVKNGSCNEVASNEKNIVVSLSAPTAQAGADQFLCSALSSAALNASNPFPGTGTWNYVSSVPEGLPAPAFERNNPNTKVVIASENAGLYVMRWTVTNGFCSTYDDVTIDFGTDPTNPAAGNDQVVCGTTTNLEGNIPAKGQGRWTMVNGPQACVGNACSLTISNPTSPTSAVALSGPSPRYGTYTVRWSISSGGNNCFLKSDDVAITFQEPVTVMADDISGICLDSTNPSPAALVGKVSGPFTKVEWIKVSGYGSVRSSSQSNEGGLVVVKSFYEFTQKDYELGEPIKVKLVATPANNSCLPNEKIILINFEKKQIANAGTDIENVCDQNIKLNAVAPWSGIASWSTTQPGVTFDDVHDPQTIVRNLPAGKTSVTWSITNTNGVCPAVSSTITITRVALPETKDITVTECAIEPSSTKVTLTDYENSITSLTSADRNISWYKNAAPPDGTLVNTPSASIDATDGQVFIARVQDIHTQCSSDAKVTVNVRALPAVMNSLVTRCEDVAGSSTASGIDLNESSIKEAITKETNVSITWHHTETDAVANQQPIQEDVMVYKHKNFFARVVYQDSPYCYSIAKLDLLVNPQPAIRSIMGKEAVCQGQSSSVAGNLPVEVYQVMPVQGAKYHWKIPPDSKFVVFGGGGENDFYILLQFPDVYSGKIGVVAELNGCTSPLVEKQITVGAAPQQPEINGDVIACQNESVVAFSVSPNNFPSSTYNWEIRKLSDNTAGGAFIMEGQLTGNILVNFTEEDVIISVRENNTSCVSPVATKVVKVTSPPKANLVIEKGISSFAGNDGIIKTEVTGGTTPYVTYKLLQTGQTDSNNDGVFDHLSQGNYSVQVTDVNGCSAVTNVLYLEHPSAVVNASFQATPLAACFPVTIQLQNLSTGADVFLWELYRSGKLIATSNLNSPDFKVSEPGIYDVHLAVSLTGTDKTDDAELKGIQVFDAPHAAFELRNEVIYAPDTQVELINFSAGANQYTWDFGDGTTSNEFDPTHAYQKEGRYSLVLLAGYDYGMIDINGDGTADQQMVCYDSIQREVVALNGGDLKIPNAFTPNTDGPNGGHATSGTYNDVFIPLGKGITEFKMQIFDRWGSLIFESNDKHIGWDGYDRQGKLMPAGAYIYKIIVRLSDNEKITRLGDVTIIR
jgi:gliding motility-associated-like protein